METRDAIIWEVLTVVEPFREEITQIENLGDADALVEELLLFYRGVDEMVGEVISTFSQAPTAP